MKFLSVVLCCILFLFQSCTSDPCAENFPINIIKTVGRIDLLDSTKQWIESVDTVLSFMNNMGNIANMAVSAPYFETQGKIISTTPIPSQCSNTFQQNMQTMPVQKRKYLMASQHFNLVLSREKNEYSNYVYDSSDTPLQRAMKMGDELQIDMKIYTDSFGEIYNETPLIIIPKDKWVMARRIIYDTLTVGNALYHNVYYCYRDTSDLSWAKSEHFDLSTYPMGVYYAFNNGIIGFTLLNGDYWFRK